MANDVFEPTRDQRTSELIDELFLFSKLSDVEQFEQYQRRENAIDNLVATVEAIDDFDGGVLESWRSIVTITRSAKQSGKWQVTVFDCNMQPKMDFGAQSKTEALREFFTCYSPAEAGA